MKRFFFFLQFVPYLTRSHLFAVFTQDSQIPRGNREWYKALPPVAGKIERIMEINRAIPENPRGVKNLPDRVK